MKCCNPECNTPFDHREGRLVRFSGTITNARTLESQSFVQHFWLCGKCAARFVFDTGSGRTRLKVRDEHANQHAPHRDLVPAA